MPTEKDTPFKAFDFSDEELTHAQFFTPLQYKHIQTEMAVAAAQRLLIQFDGTNDQKVIREAEHLRGKVDMCAYLLSLSDGVRERLEQAVRDNSSELPQS